MLISPSIDYAAQTDTGLIRLHNEDAIAVCPESAMTILADGMGGYNAGEVASAIAVTVIKKYVDEKLQHFLSHLLPSHSISYQTDILQKIIKQSVVLANETIFNAALNDPAYFGMGTTLVMSLCCHDILLVAHVGDSRAYRFRDGQLVQITRDHSVVQEQIDAGIITADSAQYLNNKNLITRAVGVFCPVNVEVNLHQIQAGDVYMLCSDGLSDRLTTQKIQSVLQKKNVDITKKCSELIELANQEGGHDNISVILFRVNNIHETA